MSHLNQRLNVLIAELSFARSKSNYKVYEEFGQFMCNEHREYAVEYCFDKIVSAFLTESIEDHDVFDSYEMVAGFFVNLCQNWSFVVSFELINEQEHNNHRILLILRCMFALAEHYDNINVAFYVSRLDIWDDFMNSFKHRNYLIRLLCLENAVILLKTCKSFKIITSMRRCMQSLLLDKKRKIRIRAIEAIEEISNVKVLNVCCPKLMKKFASRCNDKHGLVRFNALWSAGQVYRNMVDNVAVNAIFLNHIFKLSSACLLRYKISEYAKEQIVIENIFQTVMLGVRTNDSKAKAKNLLKLCMFCTDEALRGMASMLLSHRAMRTFMHSLLTYIKSSQFNEKGLKKKLLKLETLICSPNIKPENASNAIHFLFYHRLKQDRVLYEQLINIFSEMYVNWQTVDAAIIHLKSDDADAIMDEDCESLIHNLVLRSGLEMMDEKFILSLLTEINNIQDLYCIRMACLIVLMSNAFPQLFTTDAVKEAILGLDANVLIALYNESISSHFRIDERTKYALRDEIGARIPCRSPSPEV